MTSDQDKITAFLNSLAGTVVHAIRGGTADDRKRLIATLRDMNADMPSAVSTDAGEAGGFLSALVSLLEGNPVSAEGLAEPYAGIYAGVVTEALSTRKGGVADEMRDFLTQLSATVLLMMRKGSDEDKKAMAERLREISSGMPQDSADAGAFVLALVSILEGTPVAPDTLKAPYSGFYRKVSDSIRNNSR